LYWHASAIIWQVSKKSSGMDNRSSQSRGAELFAAPLIGRKWLTDDTFEIRFERPIGFEFMAGQKVKLVWGSIERNYSLISAPRDRELAICVRCIPQGQMTPVLAGARIGQVFQMTAGFGFFVFRPSPRPVVFVATGTGIAPFVAFVRAGVRGFRLLHGVRHPGELYYQDLLAPAADAYIACLSGPGSPRRKSVPTFAGRVTSYVENELPPADYDFYLCGRSEMVRDIMGLVDNRFPGARVFTEIFY
jgi:benzoate/toluate 1,2-dioxygenase reductase component